MRIDYVTSYLKWIKDDCNSALHPLRELLKVTNGDRYQLETLKRRVGYIWHIADDKEKELAEWLHLDFDERDALLDSLPKKLVNKMLMVRVDAGAILKNYQIADLEEQTYVDDIRMALNRLEEHHNMLSMEILDIKQTEV
jgi:hypothetical protein